MNGRILIDYVRQHVRDRGYDSSNPVLSDYSNNYAGRYWQDYEILLALNNAQMVVLESFVEKKDYEALSILQSTTTYLQTAEDVFSPLPTDYYHYLNGTVWVGNEPPRFSKLYMGGDVLPYVRVRDDAVFILRDTIHGIRAGFGTGVNIQFNYYRYPSKIIDGNFNYSFTSWVYEHLIARYASVLLGQKELSTQRDYKNYMRSLEYIMQNPQMNAQAGALDDGPRNY